MSALVLVGGLAVPALFLAGCGTDEHKFGGTTTTSVRPTVPTGPPVTSPSSSSTTVTTTTTMASDSSIWAWRSDMPKGVQSTYDLSGNGEHSIYGGCWGQQGVGDIETVGEEDDPSFVEYSGDTGLTLHNRRNDPSKKGCLMRKSRLPVDLSRIGKIEVDVKTTGQGTSWGTAPWYALWLVPMNSTAAYEAHHTDATAEIDLIENYQNSAVGRDMSRVFSNFAECDPGIYNRGYTAPYCKASGWGVRATDIHHHITVTAQDTAEGRVVEVRKCSQSAFLPLQTCTNGDFSQIKVTKRPGPAEVPSNLWFPAWNHDIAGNNYGKYWLVSDIWFTSNTQFAFHVDNLKFFCNDGTEWKMPLDYDQSGEACSNSAVIV